MYGLTTLSLNGAVYLMDGETKRAIRAAHSAEEVSAVLFYRTRSGHAVQIGKV